MKIDAHVHLNVLKHKNIEKAALEIIKGMKEAGIDKVVLLPDNETNVTKHVKEACELFPDKFYGYGMVNPKDSKKKIFNDIDRLAKNKWFKGIKIHPRTQHFTLDEPGVFHIAKQIGQYNLPLTIDCFPSFKSMAFDERMLPGAFDRLAKANHATNIVMAHMGGHRLLDAFAVGRSNDNIYFDVAYTFYYYKDSSVIEDMMFAVKKLGAGRVIYGSDHPCIGIKNGFDQFDKLCRKHKLDSSDKKNIFGETIARLLNLEGSDFKLPIKDKSSIKNLYEARLKKYGTSVQTMGWCDKNQQNFRFKMLAKIGKLNNRSVLDVGCGFGDFYDYLESKGIKVKYTGFDLSGKIITIARRKHPNLHFEVKDILSGNIRGNFDYVLASGILSKKVSDNASYAKAMLQKMFRLATRGVAVNMFTTNVDFMDREDNLYYYMPDSMKKFAKNLSHKTRLKRNGHLHDYTLYIDKT